MVERFDLVVIGSGPAGEKGAVQAAYFGKKVALVEKAPELGGACVHTGTLPSKTLRETALYVTGFQRRNLYGMTLDVDRDASLRQLMGRLHAVTEQQVAQIARNLDRHGVTIVAGEAEFVGPQEIVVRAAGSNGGHAAAHRRRDPHRDRQLAAPPARRPLRRSRRRGLRHDPRPRPHPAVARRRRRRRDRLRVRLPVRGARHGDHRHRGARLADGVPRRRDVGAACGRALERDGHQVMLGDAVSASSASRAGRCASRSRAASGSRSTRSSTRRGAPATRRARARTAGVTLDARGRILVNEHFQTSAPHIYAAGDVIGNPALASVSMEQGRVAMCHAFGFPYKTKVSPLTPFGVYTIPEISMVGATEDELRARGVDYEVGRAPTTTTRAGRSSASPTAR